MSKTKRPRPSAEEALSSFQATKLKPPATASTAPGCGRTIEEFDMLDPNPETWRPVAGYEGLYSVSSRGYIYSHITRRPMSQTKGDRTGHLSVGLRKKGITKSHFVHRLVLEAFVGPGDGLMCRHIDGNPTNNHITNLCWGTAKDNAEDARRLGEHPNTRKTHCKHGHEFTPENTVTQPNGNGGRACRECRRRMVREYGARRRAEKRAEKQKALQT